MATKKRAKKSASNKGSLVENINRRKRAGTSRPKSRSTVSAEAYDEMQTGWPKSAKKAGAGAKKAGSRAKKAGAKKAGSGAKKRGATRRR